MVDSSPPEAARVVELDGLRGIAVLLVLAAHLFVGTVGGRPFAAFTRSWVAGGGVVGVQLFFVLSGFLITGILLRELDCRNTIRLGRFYGRRARRLLPAVLVLCAGYVVLVAFTGIEVPSPIGPEIAGVLTYTYNFALLNDWGYLGHTWSLAVEEQFYLVWPLLCLVGWRIAGRRGVGALALAGIVLTVALRSGLDLTAGEVYERLRWDALLAGCLLAVVRPRVPRALGIAGFALLGFHALSAAMPSSSSYVATAFAGAIVVGSASRFSFLRSHVLGYFGRISYGLYLWSGLILHLGWPGPVGLGLSVLAGDLSYRLVERRFWSPTTSTVTPVFPTAA